MSNALVDMLRQNGFIGKERAISREWAARYMKVPVREIQDLSEQTRNAGLPVSVVGYTSAGKKKGIFLCKNSSEIEEMMLKITREAKTRLAQRKGLKRALAAIQPNTVFASPPDGTIKQEDMFQEKKA